MHATSTIGAVMKCPDCKSPSNHTYDSRKKPDGTVRRFRKCDDCGRRFKTTEMHEGQTQDLQKEVETLKKVKKDTTTAIRQMARKVNSIVGAVDNRGGE
jgi:transcriptional regulator NrdR family protein